ncbi:FYVE and coiled-coil domain-containing protein 1-like [Saccostrea cucullata]|uniref:FYVE and coiled-coil domain-containing protein 1-like n=1 Tax=Saccostrea cuccullata TaxID=36930 RepID=UPI002ED5B841
MDPRYSAQDILLCDLCQKAALQSRCEFCQINLCTTCVGIHLISDSSQRHKVVLYKHRKSASFSYPKCPSHTQELCELYCEKCDIPVCSICISSDDHQMHKFTDILKKLSSKTKDLAKDLEELEKKIYPAYEEITLDLKSERVNSEKHYENLKTAVTKQGEDWHSEINIIKILDSNDVSVTSVYKSRNAEFRRLPPKVNVSLPSFSPHQINTEQFHQMFGSITTEERDGLSKNYIPPNLQLWNIEKVVKDPLWQYEQKIQSSAKWMDEKTVTKCLGCKQEFTFMHHCRLCGGVFCNNCSNNYVESTYSSRKSRACNLCYQKYTKSDALSSSMISRQQDDEGLEDSSELLDGNEVLSKDEIFHLVSDEKVARSQSFSSSEFQYQDPDPNVTTGITIKAEKLEKGEVNNSSEFWVKACKSHAIPVVIDKQNTVLCWEFRCHPKDVIFSVTYMEFDRPDPAVTHCLVPACKCDSHEQAVRGELTAKQTGIYVLLFDNTYSRITAKRICYSLWTRYLGD